MKTKLSRLFVLMIGIFFSMGSHAAAQETDTKSLGHLSVSVQSVTAAMSKENCNWDWLSVVLLDTGIEPTSKALRSLPIGKEILVRNDGIACKGKAPVEIALRSREIMRADMAAAQLKQTTTKPTMTAARIQPIKTEAPIQSNLKPAMEKLKSEVVAIPARATGFPITLAGIILCGLVLSVSLGVIIWRRRTVSPNLPVNQINQETELHDVETETVETSGGVKHTFTLHHVETVKDVAVNKWKCPHCTENNLMKKNFYSHLAKDGFYTDVQLAKKSMSAPKVGHFEKEEPEVRREMKMAKVVPEVDAFDSFADEKTPQRIAS